MLNQESHSFNPGDFHPPYQYGDKTKALFEAQVHDEIFKARTDVHRLQHVLSKEQYDLMLGLAGTRTIQYVNNPTSNSHAIAANLHKIAYERCLLFSKNFRSSMDIGGTPTRTPPGHHLCTKVGNSREESRYVIASILKPGSVMDRLHTHARRTICMWGAENCAYPADYAYMINVYDIELRTIADIMQSHNTRVLDAWMFMPLLLYDKGLSMDQTYYNCNIHERKVAGISERNTKHTDKRVIFTFDDFSNAYDHSYDIWRDYATKTMIVGNDSAINIEVVDSWGTFQCLRFTRTVALGATPMRTIPLGNICSEYIILPDIVAYLKGGQAWGDLLESPFIARGDPNNNQRSTWDKHAPTFLRKAQTDHYNYDFRNTNIYRKQFVVDRRFVEELRHYGNNLKKDAFTFETMSAYANAKKNKIHYTKSGNDVVIHKGIDITSNSYLNVIMNIFLQVAIDRFVRTQTIAEAFGKIQTCKDWWPSVKKFFNQFFHDISSEIFNNKQSFVDREDQNFVGGLLFMKPIYFKNFVVCDTVDASFTSLTAPFRMLPAVSMRRRLSPTAPPPPSGAKTGATAPPSSAVGGSASAASAAAASAAATKAAASAAAGAGAIPMPAPGPAKVLRSRYDTPTGVNTSGSLKAIYADPTQGGKYKIVAGRHVVNNPYVRPGVVHGNVAIVGGDGFCGRYAMEYWGIKNFSSVPKSFNLTGWYTLQVMVDIAWSNGYSLMLHRDSAPDSYYPAPQPNSGEVICIDQVGHHDKGHWQPIICECDHSMHINCDVGDYGAYAYGQNILWVNCANDQLSDGAGQALSFRKRFQKYDVGIKKPLVGATHFVKFKDPADPKKGVVDACLAIAHNNSVVQDVKATHDAFRDICLKINAFCLSSGRTVLMPLVGTAIFKGNLCCLKKYIKLMTCDVIMQFFTQNLKLQYYSTGDCTHAGYRELYNTTLPNEHWLAKDIVPVVSESYQKLVFDQKPEHMGAKLEDIILAVRNVLPLRERPQVLKFFEYSAAPGKFAKHYRDLFDKEEFVDSNGKPVSSSDYYFACFYTPGYQMKHAAQDIGYNSVDQLVQRARAKITHADFDVMLDDCPCASFTIRDKVRFMEIFRDYFRVFVYKVDYSNPELGDLVNQLLNAFTSGGRQGNLKFINNEGSNITSGEQYFIISRFIFDEVTPPSAAYNPYESQRAVDDANLIQQAQDTTVCDCEINIAVNTTLTAKVSKEEIGAYIEDLVKYDVVVSKDQQLIDRLNKLVPIDVDIKVDAVSGVGGAGKTMAVVKSTCSRCTMLITPYRLSKKDVDAQASELGKHKFANTFVVALGSGKQTIKNIVLDEVYAQDFKMVALYRLLWPSVKFYGTGDPKQITAVDWDGKIIKPNVEMRGYDLVTRRNPKCVVDLCGGYIPGIKTISTEAGGLVFVKNAEFPGAEQLAPEDYVITFTRKLRDMIRSVTKHRQVYTAHEVHSRTLAKVHLCLTDIKQMPQEAIPRYLYTAVSRVSRELVVYGAESPEDIKVMLQGSPMERAFLATDQPLIDTVDFKEQPLETALRHEDTIRIIPPDVPTRAVEDVLGRIYVQANELPSDVLDLNPSAISQVVSQQNFKADRGFFESYDRIVTAKKLSQHNMYNRLYTNKALKKAGATLLSRYAKKLPTILSPQYRDLFFKGLIKWFRPGWVKIAIANKPKPEQIMAKMVESLVVLQTKFPMVSRDAFTEEEMNYINGWHAYAADTGIDKGGRDLDAVNNVINGDVSNTVVKADRRIYVLRKIINLLLDKDFEANKFADLETEFWQDYEYHKQVKFHMKDQPKEIRAVGFDAADKAGQGISAWTKVVNMICAGFMRYFDELLPKLVLPNVQLSYNASDADLSIFWGRFAKQLNDRRYVKFQNDFEQFDSSNEERGVQACSAMYRICGVSEGACRIMLDMGSKWKMTLVHSPAGPTSLPSIRAILEGTFQQHSGMIHTLGRNTIYNMGALGATIKIIGLIAAGFKGDDSLIICSGIDIILDSGIPLVEKFRFSYKMVVSDIPEYIANIVAPWGFIPDLLRRVSRMLSKLYKNRDEWDEIKLSMADALSVINQSNLNISMMYLERFYMNIGIVVSVAELTDIYFYLVKMVKSDVSVLGTPVDFQFLERFDIDTN